MLKLITALDLQHWADTKESEALMPELMRRLIHASLKEITYVSFPNEDNVYMLIELRLLRSYWRCARSLNELTSMVDGTTYMRK